MPLQSALSKIIATILGIAIVLIIVDIFLFQSLNTQAILTLLITVYAVNPIVSWGVTIFIGTFLLFIGAILINRRRRFVGELKRELEEADRLTLIELAKKLDETPAKIEIELNRMTSSKLRGIKGLLIISQGKHVYLGKNLLDQIIDLYNQENTRGQIAGELQLRRDELDKAISYLVKNGSIKEREEKETRKVRPSYRRGTR